jgi:hypothetical protein
VDEELAVAVKTGPLVRAVFALADLEGTNLDTLIDVVAQPVEAVPPDWRSSCTPSGSLAILAVAADFDVSRIREVMTESQREDFEHLLAELGDVLGGADRAFSTLERVEETSLLVAARSWWEHTDPDVFDAIVTMGRAGILDLAGVQFWHIPPRTATPAKRRKRG